MNCYRNHHEDHFYFMVSSLIWINLIQVKDFWDRKSYSASTSTSKIGRGRG